MADVIEISPAQSALARSLRQFANTLTEHSGVDRALVEVQIAPEAALAFGIPPGEWVAIGTSAGQVLVRSGRR